MPTLAGMRAELRDWFFNDEKFYWEGLVYGDKEEVFRDAQPIRIHVRSILEVNKMFDATIITTKGGERYFMFSNTELKR